MWTDMLRSHDQTNTNHSVVGYLQEEALDLHSDPLAWWWQDNRARFPLLSKVARKCMTICAMSRSVYSVRLATLSLR